MASLSHRHVYRFLLIIYLCSGKSIPVRDFSTDSMRWLNNAQSLEDSAQFIANFKWNGTDLSAPKTKWIYYGVRLILGSAL